MAPWVSSVAARTSRGRIETPLSTCPITRLTDTDWVELGLELLRTKGPQALTIDELCRAAGKTKGAFYHRFGGTDAYRDALLEHWHAAVTAPVIAGLNATEPSADPSERRDALNRLVLSIDMPLERSIRSWGVHDPAVQGVINQTDRERIAAVARLAEPRGSAEETLAGTAAEYAMFLGFVQMQDPGTFGLLAKWGPAAVVSFDPALAPDRAQTPD